ncbi:MAG: SBBP repeat-containing protein [Bacteroidia bacterium]
MKKTLLFLSSAVFLHFQSQAQVRKWVNDYNGNSLAEEGAAAIVVDAAGNSYIAGYTEGAFSRAFGTIKYNSSGVEQWVATYDQTTGTDYANDITIDAAGNSYVTGLVSSGGNDYATIKYDNGGSDQWSVTYDGGSGLADEAKAVAVDAAGNVYITGQVTGASGNVDIGTIKYDSGGNLVWTVFFNGSGNSVDGGVDIAVDAAGNVYVAGNTTSLTQGVNYVAIKYDSSGAQVWANEFNGSGNGDETARAMVLDAAGNIYITGTAIGGTSLANYGTVKFTNTGSIQWSAEYNGSGNAYDAANDLATDNSGNVYVTGASVASGSSFYDFATVKYSSSGAQLWVKEFNGSGNVDDQANGIAVDAAGNVYVTGQSDKPVGAQEKMNYLTLMYDTNGNVQWSDEYNGPSDNDDAAIDIALDQNGNAYVTGKSGSIGASLGITTIKYCTAPPIPTISQSGSVLTSSAASGNQWYLNGTLIPGDTAQNYSVISPGDYTVVVTNANGCSATSAIFTMPSSTGIFTASLDLRLAFYPNPSRGIFNLTSAFLQDHKFEFYLRNSMGEKITIPFTQKNGTVEIDLRDQSAGIYLAELRSENGIYRGKIIKE